MTTFYTAEEFAPILRMSVGTLKRKSQGKRPTIPCFRLGAKTMRYHLPTVIAHLARAAGCGPETIAASLNLENL